MSGDVYVREYCPACRLYRPHVVVAGLLHCSGCGRVSSLELCPCGVPWARCPHCEREP